MTCLMALWCLQQNEAKKTSLSLLIQEIQTRKITHKNEVEKNKEKYEISNSIKEPIY